MHCLDTESLIAFAMNPLAAENDEIAEHIHSCAECRMNLRLVNESLLADEWCSENALNGGEDAALTYSEARIAKFIKVLERDMKDRHGRWLNVGDSVLVDPSDPTQIELATDEAKRRFAANGYGFYRSLPERTNKVLKQVGSEINSFGPAIDRNMAVMVGKTIPALNLPTWVNFVPAPFRVAFKEYKELKTERGILANWLSDKGFLPKLETMTDASRKAIEDANFFRVYELRNGSIRFRVFAVYATPIDINTLRVSPADIDVYRSIKEFIRDWDRNNSRANCKCYILGSTCGWPSVPPIVLTDGVGVLCSPDQKRKGVWNVCHQDLNAFRSVFRSFVHGLYPETDESRVSRVRDVLAAYGTTGATAKTVSEKTGLPLELVEKSFDLLQSDPRSGYENYRTIHGESAMRKVDGPKGKPIFFRRKSGMSMYYLAKLGLLLMTAFGGEFGRQYVASGAVKMGIYAICIAVILITYAQSCFEGFCKRILEKK